MSDWHDECGHHWTTEPSRGPHACIKHPDHLDDPTNDDHKCCCGSSTWVTEATK